MRDAANNDRSGGRKQTASRKLAARAIAALAATTGLVAVQASPAAAIIDGTPAEFGQIPYEVVLQNPGGDLDCGASIIDQTHVVTAAHCLDPLVLTGYSIRYGTLNVASGGTVVPVDQVVTAPDYDPLDPFANDIALLKLANPIQYGTNAQPVILPAQDGAPEPDSSATVSGWGVLSKDGPLPATLHVATVRILSPDTCHDASGTTDKICAEAPQGNIACQGDSGDPLVSNSTLIGVFSGGVGCADPGFPGLYTPVGPYVDWINRTVAG
ncbi:serine protease [Kitasatospora sp. MBT66]|uniref:serine protease n=1 Tax=Kitasatospora sp. MBT66 TaxID=1444769 RepID=UPI00069065DF|nr:serine protease [Kitasatospora sp. MBT66]